MLQVSYWLLLLIHALAVFRLGWFVVKDKLWKVTRDRMLARLDEPSVDDDGNIRKGHDFVKGKLWDLLQCPYCVTAWVAAGVLGAHRIFVGPVPVPVWWWLAIWAGGLVIWNLFDDE